MLGCFKPEDVSSVKLACDNPGTQFSLMNLAVASARCWKKPEGTVSIVYWAVVLLTHHPSPKPQGGEAQGIYPVLQQSLLC